jgi:hypothetical protein
VSAVRGKPHAAFEAAGAGNVAWSKYWDTRNRKGEQQGIQTSTYTGAPVLDPTVNSRFGSTVAIGIGHLLILPTNGGHLTRRFHRLER